MADDIVTRLRDCSPPNPLGCVWCEAADEIERLRAERDEWQSEYLTAFLQVGFAVDEIANLRAAGDALVGALESNTMATAVVLANRWKEARRG